ncbi:MAG: UDP-N-acetylenolpyruvoylglucosamine reductase [Bacteroidetes bacterium MED-G21]|nr:MAG: UDP-N-acetylenolpyruvoylglucosamine reductase [Bacteroidetes bacterium MED-G21]
MRIFQNHSLKAYNTFRIDCKAAFFVVVTSVSELRKILAEPDFLKLPKLFLGGGSNILLCRDYEGLVILIDLKGISDLGNGLIKVQAGENWHEFVLWSIHNGYNGVENLSLIPGNIGAAPIQNIGAYGVELKDVFIELEAFQIDSGEVHLFDCKSCHFAYRESVFKKAYKGKYIILSVTLQLRKDGVVNTSYGPIAEVLNQMSIYNPSPKDVSEAVISIRSSKLPDPKEIGNSGSFFKNPVILKSHFEEIKKEYPDVPSYAVNDSEVKVPAAWLIEKVGWKAKRNGNYGVHDKQALVLVNYGGANGKDIYKLAQDIQSSVKDKFDIYLQMEVNVIE